MISGYSMNMSNNPEFMVITGPMFATKTTLLYTLVQKCIHKNQNYIVFKPSIDGRYSLDKIETHDGLKMPAVNVTSGEDIIDLVLDSDEKYDLIAVDEAFMIPRVANAVIALYKGGFNVIVSSLNLSSNCNSFKEIEKMLPWATKIVKLTSVCSVCGSDAHYTYKRSEFSSDVEIEIGGAEKYEPRCWLHHPSANERDK